MISHRTRLHLLATSGVLMLALPRWAAAQLVFSPGDVVVSVYGDGDGSGTYSDNAAAPITLRELSINGTSSATVAGTLVLPRSATTSNGITNNAISGEYGSSSEGTLQLSGDGQYLTIAGYGVNAAAYNLNPASFGGAQKSCVMSGGGAGNCYPLGQTASVPGFAPSAAALAAGVTSTITVPRVVALIGANGAVNTSTALTGVFNENNPRSAATVNGTSFYVSGQGASSSDTATQGLFVAQRGASTAAQIYGAVDTRVASIQRNQLFLSSDSTEGSGVTENISSVGSAGNPPTSATTPAILPNFKSKFSVPTASVSELNYYDQNNILNNPAFTTASKTRNDIYLSPENYFFANSTTLYVADSGNPKGDNNGSGSSPQALGDGGLQKWSLVSGDWVLDYTLANGLNLVPDTTPCSGGDVNTPTDGVCGTTGLIGLAGEVLPNGDVDLFATNSTLGDLDPTFLYGITDTLSNTLAANASAETFTVLETAAPDTLIRGVSMAPVPEPASMLVLSVGIGALGLARRRRGIRQD